MSTESNGNTAASTTDEQDPIKQVKSEFSRKHNETKQTLDQIVATQQALQKAIESMAKPAPAAKVDDEVDMDTLMYDNPKEYRRLIKEEAKREALEAMRSESTSQDAVKQKIGELYNEYPELADPENELTKMAADILKGTAEHEKTNPRTYEYAVMKAAGALEVKPKSKRPAPEDDFVAPSYQSPQSRGKRRTENQIINDNKGFAGAVGINLDDPKQVEKYKQILKNKGRI